ncbi:hypothetical protein FOA52_001070 [Chlamydomonas sp. UWO 241]|nr:hypothetical protein FOA52_001070 [Chlamydomonas sp. UWO 241]
MDSDTAEADAAAAGLTDELSRRLTIKDAASSSPGGAEPHGEILATQAIRLLCEERHAAGDDFGDGRGAAGGVVSKWRQKEKLKTTAVALVLCLNIGVDPPDVIKISPCARLECWVDPMSMQPAKALETIGKNLQSQYERWQPRAKYKMHLDPTVEDVKKLCSTCRKAAKNERVLFHYNGHGVPRPTVNGEIWVFNSRYTQYIPLSIYELQSWLGTPSIYVLDCSAAGLIINAFRAFMDQRQQELRMTQMAMPGGANGAPAATADPLREVIVLAACGANETLPQNAELPADVFTACLTTPIKVALRWFCSRSLLRHDGITKELIDRIPGRQTERKTPLGELNWIFTAITDTIAWNMLPRALFQKLFRSDLLVASLFRNFLLAERIMTASGCTPVSYPRLPPTHSHPMWQAWDMAAEMCLMQLPTLLSDPGADFQPSPFFSEQLTAFELWLLHGSRDKKPPEQLPIVLQVLLSQVHRLRALVLLGRFLDMGPWAVDLALSVGIFPYVLKLLQTTSSDLRSTLVFIWCKILALDRSCQVDLIKDSGHHYFIKYLDSIDGQVDLYSRAQACFVLCAICDGHPKGQALCAASNLLAVLLKWLRSLFPPQVPFTTPGHPLLLKWLCLCLGKLCQDMPEISLMAIREGAADLLVQLLTVASPEIRAAAVSGLGSLVHSCPEVDLSAMDHPLNVMPTDDRLPAEQLIANAVRQVVYDPSVLVRCELAVLYARFVRGHAAFVQEALVAQARRLSDFLHSHRAAEREAAAREAAAAAEHARQRARGGGTLDMPNDFRPLGRISADSSSYHGGRLGGGSGNMAASYGAGGYDPSHAVGGAPSSSSSAYGASTGVSSPSSHHASRAPASPSPPAPSQAPPPPAPSSQYHSPNTYSALLDSIQMLALDPSPKVAKMGRDVLRIAQYELVFERPTATPASVAAAGQYGGGGGGGGGGAGYAGTLGSFTSKLRSRTGWTTTTARAPAAGASAPDGTHSKDGSTHGGGAAQAALAGGKDPSVSGSTAGASTSSGAVPNPGSSPAGGPSLGFSRNLYSLQAVGSPGITNAVQAADGSLHASTHDHPGGSHHHHHHHHSHSFPQQQGPGASGGDFAPGPHHNGGGGGGGASQTLPESLVYCLSKEYFSRPMLEPQASAWRETEGVSLAPWTSPVDAKRKAKRIEEIESGLARCHALMHPKLREQVYSVETGSDAVTAVCFHPYHPVVCLADSRGYVKIMNYYDSNLANVFHVTNGAAPAAEGRGAPVLQARVSFLRQLNEQDGPMLLAGCVDGSVRVWRNYTLKDAHSLATALQAVTIHLPPTHGHGTAFKWSAPRSLLFAAGGSHPEMVYCWDLHYEMCSNMIPMGAGPTGTPPSVERIILGQSDLNLLLASCNDGAVRVFDVRNSRSPALCLSPFAQGTPAAGLAFEPNGRPGVLVAVSERGEMRFMDIRKAGSVGTAAAHGGLDPAVVQVVVAHSKGGVSTLVAHQHAPLMATGTTSQVVKVWTEHGDAVGAIRAQSHFLSHKVGPVTCMTFHTYQPLLAAAGMDSVCTIYAVDNNPVGGVGAARQASAAHNSHSAGSASAASASPPPAAAGAYASHTQ